MEGVTNLMQRKVKEAVDAQENGAAQEICDFKF